MKKNQPALLGGLFIGVLSSLPVISAGNVCCCLWVISGGLLTVYLQQQATPEPIETGEAVIGGLVAGVIGGVITTLARYAMFLLMGPMMAGIADQIRQQIGQNPNAPPWVGDMVTRMMSGSGFALVALIQIPCFAVFAILGALLGLAFFRKKTPPATQV